LELPAVVTAGWVATPLFGSVLTPQPVVHPTTINIATDSVRFWFILT
jgi:hypothetical protein